jgi:hypothetical protein
MGDQGDDLKAINAVISRQFASLNWRAGTSADWAAFAADFSSNATLYPASRPAAPQTVEAFIERIRSLSQTTMRSFQEIVLGTKIHVFGNIAVAIAAAEMTENDADANRNVEMLLLVKSESAWRIVSQAWDRESRSNPIPDELISGSTSG